MTAVGASLNSPSPYARAVGELYSLGYHPIPIMPLEKAPGEFKGGRWWRMKEWQRFRDRAPTEFERSLWARNMPDANVGVVLGSGAGQHDGVQLRLVAVDVDTTDADEFDELIRALPFSPMVKRGAKGETRFYRAPASIKSRSYSAADKRRLIDFLTGNETRQTVVPPSIHTKDGAPTGYVYAWLAGPVAAAELPIFGEDELERLEDTLSALGWDPDAGRAAGPLPARDPEAGDSIWREVNNAALANIEAWVHDLGLYKLRRSGGRYECVGTWRPSSTGRPLDQRGANLKIHPGGIRDFHEDKAYTPIDLVMSASSVDRPVAVEWLRGKLGFSEPEPMTLVPRPRAPPLPIASPAEEYIDPETGEVLDASSISSVVPGASSKELDELPDELTRVPGLLGELVDYIADSSRRPQRALSLGAALTLIGTAAGRKFAGPTRTGTHLYVIGIARTGAAKNHALDQIPRVLQSADLDPHLGPSQFMSLSAVVNRVTRGPLLVCPMDEFGSFLGRINSRKASTHERAISGMLRTLWGASFQTVSPPEWAGRSADPIHSPALSIYGVSTPQEFYDGLAGGDVHNGFLNRFLLFSTRKRTSEREPKADPFTVPESIRAGMHAIYSAGSVLAKATSHSGRADAPLITATWADRFAQRVYAEFGRQIEEREADVAFLARTVEMAQRIALIRAIGRDWENSTITVDDMEWGKAVALWSAERMIAETADYMAENENQNQANRVVRILRERGRTKHGDLVRAMQHQVKARDLKDLIASLVEAGQIAVESERPPQGGTEMRWYSAV